MAVSLGRLRQNPIGFSPHRAVFLVVRSVSCVDLMNIDREFTPPEAFGPRGSAEVKSLDRSLGTRSLGDPVAVRGLDRDVGPQSVL